VQPWRHRPSRAQVTFAVLPDAALVRYLEKYNLPHRGLDRPALLAAVHSHFDTLYLTPVPASETSPRGEPAAPPLVEAAIIEGFFTKLLSGTGRPARRGHRGWQKRGRPQQTGLDDGTRGPAADWDALPLEEYGKGRRQRRAKVKTDLCG
jgi:hypothetical protein